MLRSRKQVGSAEVPLSYYLTVMTTCAHCKNAALVAIDQCETHAFPTRCTRNMRILQTACRVEVHPDHQASRAYHISVADNGAEEHMRRERNGRVRMRRIQQRNRQRDLRHLGLHLHATAASDTRADYITTHPEFWGTIRSALRAQ